MPAEAPATEPRNPALPTKEAAGETAAPAVTDDGAPLPSAEESPPPATEPAAPADPYADMPHPPDQDSGRHQLTAADVKETVANYRPHMREICWLPRVNDNPKGPRTARVAIEVEVTGSGEVESIRAVGGKGYDGLADCVKEHVERWHFPRAKQSSSLMFPVLFKRGESTLIRVD